MKRACRLRYLGHSAWILSTPERDFLFDYGRVPRRDQAAGLQRGTFDLAELRRDPAAANRPLFIFSSHQHGDHVDLDLHQRTAGQPGVTWILGCDPDEAARLAERPGRLPRTYIVKPRMSLDINGLALDCSGSTDSGVSFLIHTPQERIWFGGDLAVWDDEARYRDGYAIELAWLADRLRARGGTDVNIAFVPAGTSDGWQEEPLLVGIEDAVRLFKPQLLVPMHGHGYEHFYDQLASRLRDRFPDLVVAVCRQPGEEWPHNGGTF